MGERTIETKAIISAEDRSGSAFSSFLRRLSGMEKAAREARTAISTADRAAEQSRRSERAHQREQIRVQREVEHHGFRRYVAQTAATAVAAHSIVDVIRDSVLAGAKYQHEVTALQNAGRNAHEMEEITRAARDAVAQLPTSTYTENLKVINETVSAFGSVNHAIENLPFMQKSASVLQAASPEGTAVNAADLGNKMARAFEERGTAGNAELFRKEAAEVMRGMAFSGGKFNPDELLNFAQQAKSSLQNYDLRFLSKIAPSLIGTQGGERAGTAANAFTSVVMGKANDKKQAEAWMQYGLLDPKQTITKGGHVVSWTAGAVKETDLALRDPLEWAEKVALPALKAKGIKVDDRIELAKALGTMFRNQNSNFFANELMQVQQRQRLHKDEDLINKAGSLDEIYDRNLKQDPTVAIRALTASLDNLMTAVSGPAMSTAAAGLTSLATGIQAVSNAAKDHPLAAMTGGGLAAAGALGGAGYASYQLLNGFGLSASATALDGSAAALTAAAGKVALSGGAAAAEHAADKFLAGGTGAAASAATGTMAGAVGTAAAVVVLPAAALTGYMGYHGWGHVAPEDYKKNDYGFADLPGSDVDMRTAPSPSLPSRKQHTQHPFSSPAPIPSPIPPILQPQKPQPPQQVAVRIEPPPPIKGEFSVTASSALLSIVEAMKSYAVQLKASAGTEPGGLGETHTQQ